MSFSLSQWFKGKRTDEQPAPRPAGATAGPSASTATLKQPPGNPRTTVQVPARAGAPHSAMPNPSRAPSARPAQVLPVGPVRSTTRVGRVPTSLPPRMRKSPPPGGIALVHPMPERIRESPHPEPTQLPAGPDMPVVLEVGDFIDRIPAGLLRAGTPDRRRRVEFRSSELFSDLARGRASVTASIIYKKCPEVFSHAIGEGEDALVSLPLQKLVEQMAPTLKTRPDQAPADFAAEIDTPFRQAAIEDSERLPPAEGTTSGPIPAPAPVPVAVAIATKMPPEPAEMRLTRPVARQISAIPTVRVSVELPSPLAPPTAQSAGPISALKRPPSTVRASVAGGKIRLSGPAAVNRGYSQGRIGDENEAVRILPQDPSQQASPSLQVSKKTARIHLPPISLRIPGNARPPAPAPPKALPPQPAPPAPLMPAFRPAPTADKGGAATFRSTPPAPRPSRTLPGPFAPIRPSFPPPAFPSAPPPQEPPPPSSDAAAKPASPALPPQDEREISLRLAPVLRGIPPSLLSAEASNVPEDLEFTLPFRLIEPQLSNGRVAIARHIFVRALPESHRDILGPGDEPADIPLPLEEVFRRLPSNALALRPDQVVQESGEAFPTPFKQKAEEDAQRFGDLQPPPVETPAAEPPAKLEPPAALEEAARETVLIPPLEEIIHERRAVTPPEQPAEEVLPTPAAFPASGNGAHPVVADHAPIIREDAAPPPAPESPAAPSETPAAVEPPAPAPELPRLTLSEFAPHVESDAALQVILMSDEDMDAKTVVRLVSQLPGITGCTVMFGDGFRLAGNFPEEGQAEGFSAMAPAFYKRAANFAGELGFGDLQAFTLYTGESLLSFFMHGDICLSVKHSGRGFLPGVREKLQGVTREMATKYAAAAHPAETAH